MSDIRGVYGGVYGPYGDPATERDNLRAQLRVARDRGDILWYTLDDVVSGRISALAEAETVVTALEKNKPL